MSNARILATWLARALCNALAGGAIFAVVGAFCGAGTGFIFGLVFFGSMQEGVSASAIGSLAGIACGIAGILIHLMGAIGAEPGEWMEPFFDLTARVSWGQMWGTIIAIAAFLAVKLVDSQIYDFGLSSGNGNAWIFFGPVLGAPILMICGAIAGAIFKRD